MEEQIIWYGVGAIPAVVGLVEIIKQTFLVNPRFAGAIAVVLSLAAGVTVGLNTDVGLGIGIAQGVTVGLGASGAWSAGKAISGR